MNDNKNKPVYKVFLVDRKALKEDIKIRTEAGYELVTMTQSGNCYTVVYKKLHKVILNPEGDFYAY